MTFSIAQTLRQKLHQNLQSLSKFKKCALLNYPNYGNIGDHLIGLGTVIYISDILNAKISYAASLKNFNSDEMECKTSKDMPILLQGGGNLGDLWYEHQKFRERIISRYKENPIVILPQTIYFKNQGCLKKAMKVFNSHPNLTIFCRDIYSYNVAREYFSRCQIFLATDMAFELANMPMLLNKPQLLDSKILYLRRNDKELNQAIKPETLGLNLVVDDWVSYKYQWLLEDVVEEWVLREFKINFGKLQSLSIRTLVKFYREFWQRGVTRPREILNRWQWMKAHPYRAKFRQHDKPFMYDLSLDLIHSGIYQFEQHFCIVTNRLHGHILSLLLGIPHIFLPNAYHKNTAFYKSWSHIAPFCQFIEDESKILRACHQLNPMVEAAE